MPLSYYLRDDLKVTLPLSCTGEPYEGTGKGIVNECVDSGGGWGNKDFASHWHGCDLYENWEKEFVPMAARPDVGWAKSKCYALSDDGGGYNIPVEKRGVQNPSNPARWSVNAEWRIDAVKRIDERTRSRTRSVVRYIEWMPMEFKSDTCRPGDLNQAVSVDVYWQCAQALWGIDIRRTL